MKFTPMKFLRIEGGEDHVTVGHFSEEGSLQVLLGLQGLDKSGASNLESPHHKQDMSLSEP